MEVWFRKGIRVVEVLGLLVISIATVVAGVHEVSRMVQEMDVHLADLLLLFIYLEVLAMAAIYLESGKLPIRLPLYIAIVALARYLILEIHEMSELKIIVITSAILIITLATLALRYSTHKYPSKDSRFSNRGHSNNQRRRRTQHGRNKANNSKDSE